MAAKRGLRYLCLVGAAALSACNTMPTGKSVPAPSVAQQTQEGNAAWFFNAASSVTLSYEQQSVLIQLGQTLRAESEEVNVARLKLVNLVADGMAAGTFDDAAISAAIEQVSMASQQRGPSVVQALVQLHAALTQAQRQSIAGSVNQAAYSVSTQSRSEKDQVEKRVNSYTASANLTDAQNAQVKSDILAGFRQYAPELTEESNVRLKELAGLAKGFAGFYFQPTPENVNFAWELDAKAKRFVALSRTLTGILTPAQRIEVAGVLRTRANYN